MPLAFCSDSGYNGNEWGAIRRHRPLSVDTQFLKQLRTLGIVEGCSTLLLFFVAMPLKYLADMPVAVTVVGSVHGFLFVLLVGMFVLGTWKIPISYRLAMAGIVGAILPGGPFVVDRWLGRVASAPVGPSEGPSRTR